MTKVENPTILVVDDEAPIRHLVGAALRSCGFEVLEAEDGVEAIRLAARWDGRIDLLVTDWLMPRMGGDGLIRHLKSSVRRRRF